MIQFQIDDIVVALQSVQGLRKGDRYTIVGMTIQRYPWGGLFVSYSLCPVGVGFTQIVQNGALLLQLVERAGAAQD
jgi:hypothetical protein